MFTIPFVPTVCALSLTYVPFKASLSPAAIEVVCRDYQGLEKAEDEMCLSEVEALLEGVKMAGNLSSCYDQPSDKFVHAVFIQVVRILFRRKALVAVLACTVSRKKDSCGFSILRGLIMF
ncbi:hypothetical protein QQP08_021442 [Theobroma cacao]|nr:hypothetical protein QQP08_021442 [Theobroma cacao]